MIAALSLFASSFALLAPPPETGLQGQSFIYISYGVPGAPVAPPSVQLPVATSFTVYSAHSGRGVAHVVTDAGGNYSLLLPPGSYILAPDALTYNFCGSLTIAPFEVTVHPKEFSIANMFYFHEGPCRIAGTNP